jgi:GAF domain-containing protein
MASEARWPAFASRAYQRGINSVISTPLLIEGRTLGALNIYSRTPRAFAPPQGELAWRLASQAAKALEVHATESTDVEDRAPAAGGIPDRRTCRERRRISSDGVHGERRIAFRDGRAGVVIPAARIAASLLVEAPVGARSD